jgi:formylglycine-generating enzyme required for sulfatase activity
VPKIAISYRRADTDVMAGRIRDRLADRYGEDAVFMDIDDIPYGKDFRVHISEAIVQSDILLVIVGRGWLGTRGGSRRIDDEADFVRLEVETAMSNAVPIIPVLAGSERMPQPAQLPESLQNFAFLNAASVDTGRDFHQHMERLIRSIDQIWPDRRTTSPATSGSRDEVASPTGPASDAPRIEAQPPADGERGPQAKPRPREETRRGLPTEEADADRPDLSVFSDAPFAPEMVVLRAGEFMMGSTDNEEGSYHEERPQHRVTIAQRFAIGRYPVTFDEYDRFCEATRREKPRDMDGGRGRRPVINVSREDAQAYVAWLSQETGRAYRLPSEAEWEYACRAGTTSRYSFGDVINPDHANYADLGLHRTNEVGTYPANPWGLHDMHGNVWEWVEDDWHDNYRRAPTNGSAWKDTKTGGVLRGGSWADDSGVCRSAYRGPIAAGSRLGFRVARTLS